MIPPSQQLRLRSISRWLKESSPSEFGNPSQSEALAARAAEIDAEMMDGFHKAADQIEYAAMSSKTWGSEESLRELRTQLLNLWQETVAERLPTIDPIKAD